VAENGAMGFYSGVKPRLARVILDVALTFSIFGALKRKIQSILMARRDKANA
jgi:hypothetical protein